MLGARGAFVVHVVLLLILQLCRGTRLLPCTPASWRRPARWQIHPAACRHPRRARNSAPDPAATAPQPVMTSNAHRLCCHMHKLTTDAQQTIAHNPRDRRNIRRAYQHNVRVLWRGPLCAVCESIHCSCGDGMPRGNPVSLLAWCSLPIMAAATRAEAVVAACNDASAMPHPLCGKDCVAAHSMRTFRVHVGQHSRHDLQTDLRRVKRAPSSHAVCIEQRATCSDGKADF